MGRPRPRREPGLPQRSSLPNGWGVFPLWPGDALRRRLGSMSKGCPRVRPRGFRRLRCGVKVIDDPVKAQVVAAEAVRPSRASRPVAHPQARARTRNRGWLVRRMLLGADVAGLATAFFAAELIASYLDLPIDMRREG